MDFGCAAYCQYAEQCIGTLPEEIQETYRHYPPAFKTGYLAAHPGGTVKVGDLLDSDLKTEYDNLYVCDCSVIPEAWGLPPTLTIIGLGKRLAKHLSGESSAQESLPEAVEDQEEELSVS